MYVLLLGESVFAISSSLLTDRVFLEQAWKEARTGFPWIDAIMTQLKQVNVSGLGCHEEAQKRNHVEAIPNIN